MPILFFGNLCIQHRPILPKKHTFHKSDFFVNIVAGGRAGIVENIKCYRMPFLLQHRHNTVFLFLAVLNSDIMLCYTLQHIDALPNVNNMVVEPDAINARVVIFRAISVSPELRCHIFFITIPQILTSSKVIM